MKTLLLPLLAGTLSSLLFAQTVEPAMPFNAIIQYGCLGLLGFVVFWIMTRTLPGMAAASAAAASDHRAAIAELVSEMKETRTQYNDALMRVVSHCMARSGEVLTP